MSKPLLFVSHMHMITCVRSCSPTWLCVGKLRKQGNNVRRSVTVLASSRQKVATPGEERESRRPSTAPQKAGLRSPAKTALKNKRKSEVQTDSRDNDHFDNVQRQSQRRTLIAKPPALSLSRNGAGVKKVTRSQEDKDGGADSKANVQNMRPPKKGKRVMRLDPQDKTSKRLFEGYPLPGEEGKDFALS